MDYTDLREIEEKLNLDLLEDILKLLNEGKIKEEAIKGIMKDAAEGKKLEQAVLKEETNLEKLEEEIMNLIKKEKPGLSESAYMGLLMAKYRGKVSGKELIELIRKYMKV